MQALKSRTANQAVGRWPGILTALGINASHLRNKHGPCPACGGKDRFRFDDKDGRGTWFCSRCGSGDGFTLLHRVFGWDYKHAAKEVDRFVGTVPAGAIVQTRTEGQKLQALREVWTGSRPVCKGDPVWSYLNARTGIDIVPADIRFHPALRHSDGGRHPAMVALMRYPNGEAVSLHRTYLTNDGRKAPVSEVRKFMQGKPLQTAAVKLFPVEAYVGIAEGIETALAASMRFGAPVWAATNAQLLEAWMPPIGIERVLIAADNDASYTGQAAAFALARRLVRDGYAVQIKIPPVEGKDWADEVA